MSCLYQSKLYQNKSSQSRKQRYCQAVCAVFSAALMLFSTMVFAAREAAESDTALHLQGNFIQGGLVLGKVAPGSRVEFNQRPLSLDEQGYFVFGFDRDAKSGDTLKVISPDGEETQKSLDVAARDYDIQYIEGVQKKHVTPDPKDLQRIRADNRAVKKARDKRFQRSDFRAGFQWPLLGPITGVFGSQRVYNGQPRRPHYGVDVSAKVGTLVYAPAGGVVTLAHPDMFFSGGTLIIDHGHGLSSTFLHLSEILVKPGMEIKQGQVIAKVGATGRATGPHLDWRMNWYERRVDPQLLVGPMPEHIATQGETDASMGADPDDMRE